MGLEFFEISKIALQTLVLPLGVLIFRLNNKIIVLETRLNNKKDYFAKLFNNDEKYLKYINEVNIKLERLQEAIKHLNKKG